MLEVFAVATLMAVRSSAARAALDLTGSTCLKTDAASQGLWGPDAMRTMPAFLPITKPRVTGLELSG
ncbi:hypothetical protein B7H17_15715 [Pseudomonas putida]|uniref:Uncharacterized protein n=1 Tax=Pseudomonas putida TaxID=303 RepID=A0A1X0ZTX8_PSEPU|nr:hypothetical protein B7H17_15715 [Pseudomonas putida]